MRRLLSKVIETVFRRPVAVIIAGTVLFLAAAVVLPDLKIDNSVDVFFNKKGASYLNFEAWKEQFGSDEIIIIALEAENIFTPDNLRLIDRLTRSFDSIPHVDNVTSLTTVNNIMGREQDFIVERLIDKIPEDAETLIRLRSEAARDELYAGNVISRDARVTAIMVELEQAADKDDRYKKQAIEGVFDILKREVPAGVTFYVSGLTTIEHFYAAYMQDDFKAFMPFLFLMIVIVMYASFRSIKLVSLSLLSIVMSVTFSMALLYLLGYSVNNVTTIIPPILMAIMIADGVHIIGEGMERARKGGTDKGYGFLRETLGHLAFPCFLTTATTAVGFWSLTLSEIPPVRQLGMVVGFGVFFALVITFTFLPALARVWNAFAVKQQGQDSGNDCFKGKFDALLVWIGRTNEHHYRLILALSMLIVAVSVYGVFQIKAETSVIEYFKKSSPVYKATIFIEDHLSGVHTLNVSLRADAQDFFQDPWQLRQIEQLTQFLSDLPEVDKVTSVNDYLKEINKSFHDENEEFYRLPETRQMAAQYVLLYGREDLEDFVDDQWQWTTVRVRLKEHSTVKLETVIAKIQDYVRARFDGMAEARVVGQTILEVESNNTVARGQMKSLGTAMLVIFLMMFLVFRSVPVGLVSIVPNVLPILMNFGIMGLLGIRLDSATSMIAAIGIGIVVDDTIHFLYGFGETLKTCGNYTTAMHRTLQNKGRPIILTSVILFFGFGILSVSKFVPTAYFGLLSAILMVNALIADLFVLPSLLIWIKPRFKGADANDRS